MKTIALTLCMLAVTGIGPNIDGTVVGTLLAQSPPALCTVKPGDVVTVPLSVTQIEGDPADGWKTMTATYAYDSTKLQYIGTTQAYTSQAPQLGVPGRIVSANDGPGETTGQRKLIIVYDANAESRALVEILSSRFKVLPRSGAPVETTLDWISCVGTRADGTEWVGTTESPTRIRISPSFRPWVRIVPEIRN